MSPWLVVLICTVTTVVSALVGTYVVRVLVRKHAAQITDTYTLLLGRAPSLAMKSTIEKLQKEVNEQSRLAFEHEQARLAAERDLEQAREDIKELQQEPHDVGTNSGDAS